MSDKLFEKRLKNFEGEGELTAYNLALVAEALDTIDDLKEQNIGGEVVEQRIDAEYKTWDPDIFKVDKDAEDGYTKRLQKKGEPFIILSEEVERLEINTDKPGEVMYAACDPFDGSILFKRGIPDFWYSSFAFYNKDLEPKTCVVGDCIHKFVGFANETGAYVADLRDNKLVHKFQLNKAYRDSMGRKEITDLGKACVESYAMKPGKFLLPLVDEYRTVLNAFKFFLPNGGPNAFVDVAEGKIDVYFARKQPFVDVFSGIYVAMQAECVVTDFDGNPVKCVDDVHGMFDVVASTNQALHDQVLEKIKECK